MSHHWMHKTVNRLLMLTIGLIIITAQINYQPLMSERFSHAFVMRSCTQMATMANASVSSGNCTGSITLYRKYI